MSKEQYRFIYFFCRVKIFSRQSLKVRLSEENTKKRSIKKTSLRIAGGFVYFALMIRQHDHRKHVEPKATRIQKVVSELCSETRVHIAPNVFNSNVILFVIF